MTVGWVLVFIVSTVIIANGLILLLTGAETDTQLFQSQTGTSWVAFATSGQGVVSYVEGTLRIAGAIAALLGAFGATVAFTAFRKGERWAFYLFSLGLLVLLYIMVGVYQAGGSTWPVYLALIVTQIVGLILPYREFFPWLRNA
jgi:hypothetical protein